MRLISHQALATHMSYRGISVRELAMRTGINRSTIGHLRSGKRSTCAPDDARAICKALDLPTEALFLVHTPLRVAHKAA